MISNWTGRPVFFWITVPRSRTLPPVHMSCDLQANEIAASELAVDRKVEQGEISFPALQLKPNPNGPDIFRLERALLADQAALVPGSPLARNG
jgi:hypothetical protein